MGKFRFKSKLRKKYLLLIIFIFISLSAAVFFLSNNPPAASAQDTQIQAQQILVEEAQKQQIDVTEQQIDQAIEQSLAAYQMSEDELLQTLDDAGITLQQYREGVRRQMIVSELVRNNVDLSKVEVSDSEVDNYIEQNKQDLGDILEDDQASLILRQRVKSMLAQEKINELVMQYAQQIQ